MLVSLIAPFLSGCTASLFSAPKPSTPALAVKSERVALDCPSVDGVNPMDYCERVAHPAAPNCGAAYEACEDLRSKAAMCWAMHRGLVDCVTQHNKTRIKK